MFKINRGLSALLAIGMLFFSVPGFAQAAEQNAGTSGEFSADSGAPPAVYFSQDYGTMYTSTRAEWAFAAMLLPSEEYLFSADAPGDHDAVKAFGVEWDEQAYQAGIVSGAKSFSITGRYVPLTAQDQVLWDAGLITVRGDSVPRIEIAVVREQGIPFMVELGKDWGAEDSYYPVFSFPAPHGAPKVLFEASDDGVNWHSDTVAFDVAFSDKAGILSMQWIEDCRFSAYQTSYYRVTVHGSAYDTSGGAGLTSRFVLQGVPAQTKPPDSSLDDTGGNRGGGTQGETDRPGRLPDQKLIHTPAATAEKKQKPSGLPSSSQAPTPPVVAPVSPQLDASSTDADTQPDDAHSSESAVLPSSPAAPEPAVEAQDVFAATDAPPVTEQSVRDHGYAGTVAVATASIFAVGAVATYLFKLKRKP